ncbi:MAG: hypothetical protein C4530_06760 [Desulfobacteraceae bacterium]|nr:MAG: hypothetical protein C4530_06760 [Desulfobacteraceae bacterium]
MRLDQKNPVYRKVMVPWWDSEIPCLFVIIFMLFILLFGMIGLSVAYTTSEYRSFVWVPVLIAALSAAVIFSTTVRLVRRYLAAHGNSQ